MFSVLYCGPSLKTVEFFSRWTINRAAKVALRSMFCGDEKEAPDTSQSTDIDAGLLDFDFQFDTGMTGDRPTVTDTDMTDFNSNSQAQIQDFLGGMNCHEQSE